MQGFCEMLSCGRGKNNNRGRHCSLKTNSDITKCFLRGSRGLRRLIVVMIIDLLESPYCLVLHCFASNFLSLGEMNESTAAVFHMKGMHANN
jgi:hypothetical protein